jgi:hypothetical protein
MQLISRNFLDKLKTGSYNNYYLDCSPINELETTKFISTYITERLNSPAQFYTWSLSNISPDVLNLYQTYKECDTNPNAAPIDRLISFLMNLSQHLYNLHSNIKEPTPDRPIYIFYIKDVLTVLASPNIAYSLIRNVIDLLNIIKDDPYIILVFINNYETISSDISAYLEYIDLHTPNQKQVREIVDDSIEIVEGALSLLDEKIGVEDEEYFNNVEDSSLDKLSKVLLGYSPAVIKKQLSYLLPKHKDITDDLLKEAVDIKKDYYSKLGLKFTPPPQYELLGYKGLVEWATLSKSLLEGKGKENNITAPRGVLLTGLPGVGKSLAIRTLAKLWNIPIITFDLGSIMDKHLGESERKLRQLLTTAEGLGQAILYIDEMDKMFGDGAQEGGGDGGTTRRVISHFLTWFSDHQSELFIAATSNYPWLISEEMRRRFDKVYYVPLPDRESRAQIWKYYLDYYKVSITSEGFSMLVGDSEEYTGDEIRKMAYNLAIHQLNNAPYNIADLRNLILSSTPHSKHNPHRTKLEQWVSQFAETI